MLLILLLAVAIGLALYFLRADKSGSYARQTIKSKDRAEIVTGAADLVSVYKSMQIYASMNDGKFPESPEELIRAASLPRGLVFTPSRPFDDHQYIYLGGQDESMPASNILLYQANMTPGGKCQVLRLNGQVEMLTYEQVRAAIDRTTAHLK